MIGPEFLKGPEFLEGPEFLKGHGTQNDFLLLPDPRVRLELTAQRVAALCDRRRGLGADGVLRVATAGALRAAGVLDPLPAGITADDWFMDYRNADGSIAEMCGNGVRVFAHYLTAAGLVSDRDFVVGSRAGARPVTVHAATARCGDVTVGMGRIRELGTGTVTVAGREFTGLGIDVGNPHLACVDAGLTAEGLAALDFAGPPVYDPAMFPSGVNVEVLTAPVAGTVRMRVFERGVGETRSCGTGTVAAAVAALDATGVAAGEITVRVPGGAILVTIADGSATLRGPSELVASGRFDSDWWAGLG